VLVAVGWFVFVRVGVGVTGVRVTVGVGVTGVRVTVGVGVFCVSVGFTVNVEVSGMLTDVLVRVTVAVGVSVFSKVAEITSEKEEEPLKSIISSW
jgi:hypothetical protein